MSVRPTVTAASLRSAAARLPEQRVRDESTLPPEILLLGALSARARAQRLLDPRSSRAGRITRGGGGVEPMAKKPTKSYVVDGRPMTAKDVQRLHDYLVDMETISVISDQMRTVAESEWPELAHKLPPRK